ncbi:putative coatomer subunit epsilon [Wickerhamiella sorbophila]|uniref:Coatomer subunit epsilon n=1 Tax=Wickerhamiella sorbophila TaxID=45607 RepID=A0A2T0FDS5_9ASCO|nr:putative coatomer subunit epsilon [Wickerhamiella sorbophila]PRT53152.1 putative coatomer subunit epsilon [Wickerhamiella sorbophila]
MSFESLEQSFYTGDYKAVIETDLEAIADPEENFKAQLLHARARIADGKAKEVSAALTSSNDSVWALVKVYADSVATGVDGTDKAVDIVESDRDNNYVKLLGGLIFARAGELEKALALLKTHESSLECVLLTVQILLMQGRVEEAVVLVNETRKWANDHLLYNLAEAWTCLFQNKEQVQKTYYIFEELSGSHPTARTYLGETIAQLKLLRFPEASESLRQAVALSPDSDDVLATNIALALIQNEDAQEFRDNLGKTSLPANALREKSELFDRVVQKYQSQMPRA